MAPSSSPPSTYSVDLPGAPEAGPSTFPGFVSPVEDNESGLERVIRAVLKAKKVSVVVGAGVSTAAEIPDFRSSGGLFASLKDRFPSAKLSSGKDLFDVAAWKDPATLSLHLSMLAELHVMCGQAEPTAFHEFLKRLDDDGKLSRVYTQNIDGLERKAGLSYGVPTDDAIAQSRGRRKQPASASPPTPSQSLKRRRADPGPLLRLLSPPDTDESDLTDPDVLEIRWGGPVVDSEVESVPSSTQSSAATTTTTTTTTIQQLPTPRRTPRPAPVDHFPKAIPLHGDLRSLACPTCKHVEPMSVHLDSLLSGDPVPCPQCSHFDDARAAAGARTRGVALLKSSVVLYGEEHHEGERVGAVTSRDLARGRRPDLLIVAGTTLKIPGTKKLVRELSKVIRPPPKAKTDPFSSDEDEDGDEDGEGGQVHTIFLNNEFVTPSGQWKDTFDVWVRGDVQTFVQMVEEKRTEEERAKEEKARRRREAVLERKVKAEERAIKAEARAAAKMDGRTPTKKNKAPSTPKKGKAIVVKANGGKAAAATNAKAKTVVKVVISRPTGLATPKPSQASTQSSTAAKDEQEDEGEETVVVQRPKTKATLAHHFGATKAKRAKKV